MLKRISIRKIVVATSAMFALFLFYFIPTDHPNLQKKAKQELEYVDKEAITSPIFLYDVHNMLGRTRVVVETDEMDIQKRAQELLTILIKGGKGESKIPSGFQAVIPSETKLLGVKVEDGIVKVDFSKDLFDVKAEFEEKIVEAIVYTLTTIPDVKGVILYIEGSIVSKLPQSKVNLPSTLDRSFGINKEYHLTTYHDINQVTVYYVNRYNEKDYYVPVTKYLNDDRDKITIIVDELSSSPIYNTNLMSYLNSNAKLLAVEQESDLMSLKFNSYIFDDPEEVKILQEVIYTISLSVADNYDVEEVVFEVEDKEIYKSVLKTIE